MYSIVKEMLLKINKDCSFFVYFFFRRLLLTIPSLWLAVIISLIVVKLAWTEISYYFSLFQFFTSFSYDTGSMLSLLICLEHIYICYYLIIIMSLVYWTLYAFICDFAGWTNKARWTGVFFILRPLTVKSVELITAGFFFVYKKWIQGLVYLKDVELTQILYNTHINFSADASIPKNIFMLFPFHFKKAYLNNKNMFNVFTNFLKHFDILGRPLVLLDIMVLKTALISNLLIDSLTLIKKGLTSVNDLIVQKGLFNFLFYVEPKIYFFSNLAGFSFLNKAKDRLNYSSNLVYARNVFNDMFITNQFKHSGIFEAIWAIFPTSIIIGILIPSLILLYSFEDILNPQLTVKVIGNQWYWTYEFNNWMNLPVESNEDSLEKSHFVSFAFNSTIIDTDALDFGTKRLLEVDNRLVLPTNATIRFLVTGSDVLHAFAVSELGFKVDAVPGRLNQIILFINRPGIYYGQCSELCGTNHGFMPIVIEGVLPKVFVNYIKEVNAALNPVDPDYTVVEAIKLARADMDIIFKRITNNSNRPFDDIQYKGYIRNTRNWSFSDVLYNNSNRSFSDTLYNNYIRNKEETE